MKKLTIEEMKQIAKQKGGKCLSDTYIDAHSKLLWECLKDHQWESTPDKIKQGRWCPHCAGNYPLNIELMHDIAKERGGKCLSDKYINSKTKIFWECSKGHQWESTPRDIRRGTWCRKC